MRQSLEARRYAYSSSSFSTDSELSLKQEKGVVHGNPSAGASYQTFLDDRTPPSMAIPAQEILMNLGVCASGSFIPNRFLCDWVDKTRHLQAPIRQRVSQQWIEETVNACFREKARLSQTDESEDGFSSENFETSDVNEYGSNNTNKKRDSVADDACSQRFSADEDVSSNGWKEKGVTSNNGAEVQTARQLKSVPDRHSKLLHSNQQDNWREQRWRQFASHRSRSLTTVLLEATTQDWSATTKRITSPKPSTVAIPVVDFKLRRGPTGSTTVNYVEGEGTNQLIGNDAVRLDVSSNKERLGVSEHLFVAKEYTETNEHGNLMIPIKEETALSSSMALPSIVVRGSSPLLVHEESIEVNNILTNPEASVGDSAFQIMLQPVSSLSRNSSLSSSNCSAVSCSPMTIIEVGCSVTRNDIANMDMLGSWNETTAKHTPVIVLGDTCCDNYECESGSSSVSATYYDARQWPSCSDILTRHNSANEESCNPVLNELPRCMSVPPYLPSFNVVNFGVEALLSDSQQNLCVDVDGHLYCFQSSGGTYDGSHSLSTCTDYQASVGVPSTWSVIASDGEEPNARDFATQTPVGWDLAGVSSYVSKYVMPYLCGKCQYYIMRTCPINVLSSIQWDSDDLPRSSLCNTNSVGNIDDIPTIMNPSQNGVAGSNSGTIYAPERASLTNQRRVGQLGKSALWN